MDTIKAFTLHCLEEQWPATLDGWQHQQAWKLHLQNSRRVESGHVHDDPDDKFKNAVKAIRDGYRYNMPSILPAAFYCLVGSPVKIKGDLWLVDKQDEKGKIPHTPSKSSTNWRDVVPSELIDKKIALHAIIGAKRLQERERGFWRIYDFSVNEDGKDTAHHRCAERRLEYLEDDYEADTSTPTKPLETLTAMLTKASYDRHLCPPCRETVCARIVDEMRRLWDDLPKIFSLVDDDYGKGGFRLR